MQKNNLIVCGKTIRKHRISLGLTQKLFGVKVDVASATLNKIENNPAPENKPVWELIDKWNEEVT